MNVSDSQFSDNTTQLNRELDWLEHCLEARLRAHFQSEEVDAATLLPSPPALDANPFTPFASAIISGQFKKDERLILALALAPRLRPQLLDPLFTRNSTFDRPFTEFGGLNPRDAGPFQPTGQTALFLIAGENLGQRIVAGRILSQDHVFAKEAYLKPPSETQDELSAPLALTATMFQKLTQGHSEKPRFNAQFPARRLDSELDWNDLILNADTRARIEEILNWIDHREKLLDDWELRSRIREGFRSLFVGPPGTGKTLTACLLGKHCDRAVYRIDLSQVVSKYIGETERNLERIFQRAEHEEWILFFDEADALFGTRTELKDAHDRYANQEVSYLLQRIETFPGVVLLASNFRENIDEAFLRRFHSIIHFPMPSPDEIEQLWQTSFGPHLSFAEDVDLPAVSRRYRLSGGSIVNVVRQCSLDAATAGSAVVTRASLENGIRQELLKSGKTH